MSVIRSQSNPIITPQDVKPSRPDFQVDCVFNAGVIRHQEQVLLLLRVAERPIPTSAELELVPVYDERADQTTVKSFRRNDPECDFSDPRFVRSRGEQYLSSLSHVCLARSKDGVHFQVEDHPALAPANLYESYGLEDPRIVFLNGIYYIAYSAVSSLGSAIALASTLDFISYDRHGKIFGTTVGVGGSTIPIRTEQGWLEIYHGADQNSRYYLGAVLLEAESPWHVLARSNQPLMQPEADYEVNGFFGNVLFTCGALAEEGKIRLYYGAADTSLCYAEIFIADILNQLAGI